MKSSTPNPAIFEYLQCEKQGFHQGEQINIICLERQCIKKNELLCCISCIEESHTNHQTKSLKKYLFQAEEQANKINQRKNNINNVKVKIEENATNQIKGLWGNFQIPKQNQIGKQRQDQENEIEKILTMIIQHKELSIEKFNTKKKQLLRELDELEYNLKRYYDMLEKKLQENAEPGTKILTQIDKIKLSKTKKILLKNIQTLIKCIRVEKEPKENAMNLDQGEFIPPSSDSIFKLIENSNQEIINHIESSFEILNKKLRAEAEYSSYLMTNIENITERQLYKFNKSSKFQNIQFNDEYHISTKEHWGGDYRLALMEPKINLNAEGIDSFRFKFSKTDQNNSNRLILFGVCHKEIAIKNNFFLKTVELRQLNHGCYLLGSDGKTWSTDEPTQNNMPTNLSLKVGDSIICTVTKRYIYFTRLNASGSKEGDKMVKLKLVQLKGELNLHPCILFTHRPSEVEYIPSLSSITTVNDLPKEGYSSQEDIFSQELKHAQVTIVDHVKAVNVQSNNICISALSEKPIELNKMGNGPVKRFKFKVCNAFELEKGCIGLGVCIRNSVKGKKFEVNLNETNHGYYLMGNNGAVWSHNDSAMNNASKGFKFNVGDVVKCAFREEVSSNSEAGYLLVFSKGNEFFQLFMKIHPASVLHPCVVFCNVKADVDFMPI